MELVGVVDGSAKTEAHPGPKKLDSVALAGYPNVLLAVVRRVLPLRHLEMSDLQPGLTALGGRLPRGPRMSRDLATFGAA